MKTMVVKLPKRLGLREAWESGSSGTAQDRIRSRGSTCLMPNNACCIDQSSASVINHTVELMLDTRLSGH